MNQEKFPYTTAQLLKTHDLWAKKSLSQNFLCDANITDKIVKCAKLPKNADVWEVGAGPGGLTQSLLNTDIRQLTIIEHDLRFAPIYQEFSKFYGQKLIVQFGNGLKLLPTTPCHVVANIPYHITSDLLLHFINNLALFPSITLLVQYEVAIRLTAEPNSRDYGRLSVLTQMYYQANCVYKVPASAFTPPPKVDSMVVHLQRRNENQNINMAILGQITAAAFGMRRKTLNNCFAKLGKQYLELSGIDGNLRAENLSVADFTRIYQAYIKNTCTIDKKIVNP